AEVRTVGCRAQLAEDAQQSAGALAAWQYVDRVLERRVRRLVAPLRGFEPRLERPPVAWIARLVLRDRTVVDEQELRRRHYARVEIRAVGRVVEPRRLARPRDADRRV